MTRIDRAVRTSCDLEGYFLRGRKPRERWQVGMEVEKMGVVAGNATPIPYDRAEASVRAVLERYLERRAGQPVYEGTNLIGIAGPWGTISLEPGGQVEWSSPPCDTLGGLAGELAAHLEALDAVGADLGVSWLEQSVHPRLPVDVMPWMPKARYGIMKRFLGRTGRLAHRMMTQTASIQCSFDYESEKDWSRKFRAAARLAPVAVALFANSSEVDGADSGFRSFRQAIWRETDPARCELPAVVFEPGFSIGPWVEWVCDVPTIFRSRAGGLVDSGGVSFRELMDRVGCEAVSEDEWELHLSTIFTEVRSYTYIETRSADLQPDALILSVPTFWTGILYHEEALDSVTRLGVDFPDRASWREAMMSASRDGLDGRIDGRPIRETASEALSVAAWALRNGAPCSDAGGEDPARPLLRLAEARGLAIRDGRP